MRSHDEPAGLCSVDPISLGIGALGLVGGLAASSALGGGSAPAAATPQAPPPQAPPQKTPQVKPQTSSGASSFIGGVPTPPQSTGQKTLLGQ